MAPKSARVVNCNFLGPGRRSGTESGGKLARSLLGSIDRDCTGPRSSVVKTETEGEAMTRSSSFHDFSRLFYCDFP